MVVTVVREWCGCDCGGSGVVMTVVGVVWL